MAPSFFQLFTKGTTMDKTILYLGAAGVGLYLLMNRNKRGQTLAPGATAPVAQGAGAAVLGDGPAGSVISDSGGVVPAAPSTVAKIESQQAARKLGLSDMQKAKRSIAAVIATTGARSLQTGARGGVSVAQTQLAVVKQVAKSTPTKPPPKPKKKSGFLGKVVSGGAALASKTKSVTKTAAKLNVAVVKKQADFAAKNPTLTTAVAGAVGGPGAAASARTGIALYNARKNR